YDTSIGVVTNIEGDHIDHYGSEEALVDAFVRFAAAARDFVVLSADDESTRGVAARLGDKRVLTFGTAEDAVVRVSDVDTSGPAAFAVHCDGTTQRCELSVYGHHNALNAAAAIAVL